MKEPYIVWNGCDGYSLCPKGSAVFTSREKFEAFPVTEVSRSDFPTDSDGELISGDGLYSTECGRFFKEAV